MSVVGMSPSGWRLERAESSRLVWALVISVAFHLLVWGTYYTGEKLEWWQNWRWPAWMQSVKLITEMLRKPEPPPQQQLLSTEPPLLFVDVSQAQATTEPPKDAKFYSDKNSQAANPQADQEKDVPKITGEQIQVPKTQDVDRKQFTPLQPSVLADKARDEQAEMKAKPPEPEGDLSLKKPDPTPRKEAGEEPRSRPRTIKEAMARRLNTDIPGQKMKQEGGVRRRLEIASLDAKATPFGAYDAALVEAISQRWFSLLDQRDFASDARGKVVVQFVLHYDGRITDLSVAQNTVGEVLALICQKAILDPSPYASWPSDMRRLLGESRNIQFTFYYN